MRRISLAIFIWIVVLYGIDVLDRAESAKALVDLGVARYPLATEGPGETVHDWNDVANRRPFRVAYLHGRGAVDQLVEDHAQLGERFGFRKVGRSRIQFRVGPQCEGEAWGCIYSAILTRSEADLEPLLDRIETGLSAGSWTRTKIAAWLLDFVQRIPYRIPEEAAFGVRPTALVASEDWGDCDSKSLLLIHLLDRFGIEAILLSSQVHAHALVGVAVPTSGSYFEHQGRRYAWAETTAEDSPLGWRSPRLRIPNDWKVIRIRP